VTLHPIHRLDSTVHQRVRLGILAACIGVAKVDFSYLKTTLGLTEGTWASTSRRSSRRG
jgi:hypothetical protein